MSKTSTSGKEVKSLTLDLMNLLTLQRQLSHILLSHGGDPRVRLTVMCEDLAILTLDGARPSLLLGLIENFLVQLKAEKSVTSLEKKERFDGSIVDIPTRKA